MARSKKAIAKAKAKYDKEKRVRKSVTFNSVTEANLLNFVDSIVFATWVKEKIAEEIEKNESECLK